MILERASESDSDALNKFYSEMVLHGPVDIRVERPLDFFQQYRLQSSDFHTYVLKNQNNEITGTATILFREGFVGEEWQTIGYCTDLRIAPDRETILGWTEHFTPVLESLGREKNCKYFFSAIARNQGRAYNALVRTRSARRHIPRYYLLGRFELVSVLGRFPLAPFPISGIRVRRAQNSDLDAIAEYLSRKTKGRILQYRYTRELLENRVRHWPGFHAENFLLAQSRSGEIVGCVAAWDAFQVQKFKIHAYHGFSRTLKTTLNLLSLSGICHSLPKTGDYLNFAYLTHFQADNPDIFYSLLFETYENHRKDKFLLYSHFLNNPPTLPPRAFISASVPFALYTVLPGNRELPDFLKTNRVARAPDFELALL